ncbi:hypothetical protein HPB50_021039 [Hyalomma asiaticum]|uniref:Uncharacterized protein n=1 Tax=Hyalomma asiaticum TaxID=266040 RepID=A0ACB7SCR6_HYAAI|nr:hypothetical protein HPB50_021039 [Hyalomma asiaticum]
MLKARSSSSAGQQRKRKSTLSWADTVSGGGGMGPSQGPRDPLPEQVRDAEVARLRKENADLKEMVRKMAGEMTEIKKLVITQRVSTKAPVPIANEVPAPASDSSGAPKRRTVCSKDESGSQITEITNMLATLTKSVQQLQLGLTQMHVALGYPKRGLGALAERIGALERLVIPCASSAAPMQVVVSNESESVIDASEHISAS